MESVRYSYKLPPIRRFRQFLMCIALMNTCLLGSEHVRTQRKWLPVPLLTGLSGSYRVTFASTHIKLRVLLLAIMSPNTSVQQRDIRCTCALEYALLFLN